MKKNMLTLTLLSMLAMTVASCGNKTNSSDSNGPQPSNVPSEADSYRGDVEMDEFGTLPDEVRNANLSIDILCYIEGQNGVKTDIGNYSPDENDTTYRYHPVDVEFIEAAPYFGAASAFKKLCPGVQINLYYCSIADYNNTMRDYRNQRGHLPHLMHGTDHVVQMLASGYNHDVSEYENSPYYDQYNDYYMSRFNFGGFQAAFPIGVDPWGVLVNVDALENANVISEAVDSNKLPTQEYKDWVDSFTWDQFVEACRATNDPDNHKAGLSKVVEYFLSYSLASINKQFIEDGSVDLTSAEVRSTIEKLLGYENELTNYAVYSYDPSINDSEFGNTHKEPFPNAQNWDGANNFIVDEYCTFYAEAPWAYGAISTRIDAHNEEVRNGTQTTAGRDHIVDTKFDYLPYPKIDETAPAMTGVAVEGMTVGEQCPVGSDEPCTDQKRLEMEVAANFAMFMALDPRAIQARNEVEYIYNNEHYKGNATLPMSKHGARFSWQDDPLLAEQDPAKDYDDNWQYQMANWFDVFTIYTTNDQPADVINFSNIMPGFVKMLDSIYAIPGQGDDDYVTCLNYWNEPVDVPDTDSSETGGDDGNTSGTKNFFSDWTSRFTHFQDGNHGGRLGSEGYVSAVMAKLEDMQEEINSNSSKAWDYLQECVEQYYDVTYNCADHTERNNYEGHA